MLNPEEFLSCPTPDAWLQNAVCNVETLLVDHAHCEKKAASMAIKLMFQYSEHLELVHCMSRLAREELRHFEQVLSLLAARKIEYRLLGPSRYAGELHKLVRSGRADRLVDLLLIGAFIEARSCERFSKLVPLLEPELAQFYGRLHSAEKRHYENYLELASSVSDKPITQRVAELAKREAELVSSPDAEFRFHSGPLQ